jgi:hypothetical protein
MKDHFAGGDQTMTGSIEASDKLSRIIAGGIQDYRFFMWVNVAERGPLRASIWIIKFFRAKPRHDLLNPGRILAGKPLETLFNCNMTQRDERAYR